MSRGGTARQLVPAYVTYEVFRGFLDSLAQGVQEQVDRVVWDSRMGDKTNAQLVTALRFLGLLGPISEPTEALHAFAKASPVERRYILARTLKDKYGPILATLETGTRQALEAEFCLRFGTSGDTVRKSVAFLLRAAVDVGLPVAPEILQRARAVPSLRKLVQNVGQSPAVRAEMPAVGEVAGQGSHGATEHDSLPHLDPALRMMLMRLPQPGPLKAEVKNAWKSALAAIFDLVYPTEASETVPADLIRLLEAGNQP